MKNISLSLIIPIFEINPKTKTMFIEIQVSQGPLTAVNFQNVTTIARDVNGLAVLKLIDGSEVNTNNKYDNLKRHLNTLGLFK